MNVSTVFYWEKTADSPFTLEFTDPGNPDLAFSIVGAENGSNPASYTVSAELTGDDDGSGSVTRSRAIVLTTTMAGSVAAKDALTPDMHSQIKAWCLEQAQDFNMRPPSTALKAPYDPRFGK